MHSKHEERLTDEKTLLHQISTGDERAFGIIFHRYSQKVYVYALKVIKSDILAEEIVQEVFMKIWNLRQDQLEIENLDAYLRTVTRNHTLKVLRRIALEIRVNKSLTKDYQETHNDTEELILLNDSRKMLTEAIEKLPPQQKLVYTMCHLDGLKYEEVARQLNISKLTVKTHMQQALRFLRTYISNHTDIAVIFILMELLK